MSAERDVVIIGGGPAGFTAAMYAARAGLDALVLEKLSAGGQAATSPLVENYPGVSPIAGFELGERFRAGAEGAGAELVYAEATELALEGGNKRVSTSEGDFYARTVILAMGAYPRELGLEHERELRGRGVSYCAACDGMFFKGKTVAVVGGGDTAAIEALTLSRLCERVYLIHRRDTLRASKSLEARLNEARNIELCLSSNVTELLHDGVLRGVRIKSKDGSERVADCAGLFIAVGRVPDTALVSGLVELDEHGYILAGETTETKLPGVYAAGDARAKSFRQIVTAAADGAVAARMAEEYLAG